MCGWVSVWVGECVCAVCPSVCVVCVCVCVLCLDGVEKISTSRGWNTCSANKQSELRTLSCACGRKF